MEHVPVLLEEVINGLNPQPNENFLDCTVGLGGHSGEMLRRVSPQGKLLGFDKDPQALELATKNLAAFAGRFELINDDYANIKKYGKQLAIFSPLSSILLDLGISSHQISSSHPRSFSFKEFEGYLDLRMDPAQTLTAAKILNTYPEADIVNIIKKYGEERYAKEIAARIVQQRKIKKFKKIKDLTEIITRTYKNKPKPKRIDPATRTFQALRIEVNGELKSLEEFLPQAIDILPTQGRLAVISFHSLEDRICKRFFQKEIKECLCPPEFPKCVCQHKKTIKLINKKPITPSEKEIIRNPRSRSAKLRIIEKI